MATQILRLGPATVRMVSNNGPPMPMPMQVPPGHMVQQIVDENGILTHVILSQQPQGMPGPPLTVGYYGGPNGSPQQVYPTYGPQYPPYPHTQYPPHHHAHHGAPPHMHPVPPPHMHTTPPPHQCSNHSHPHIHPQGPPPHMNSHVDERAQRQKERLQSKLHQRNREHYKNPPPSPRRHKVNGDIRRVDANSSSSSADGQDIEEERRDIREILSKMQSPKVSDIDARSALIQLVPPECNQQEFEIEPAEFKYELLLSDKGKEGKYKLVYSGDATEITLKDLKPASEYYLRVSALLDDLKGDSTECVSFKTQACEPDPPIQPKLAGRTKTALQLKWNATAENGSKITSYILEYDQGRGDGRFTEVHSGLQKQYKVTKLTASTRYVFRLASVNSVGKSGYSDTICCYTSGSAPSQPDPPMLSEPFIESLLVSWIRRPNDDEFMLQMDDEMTGHGFLTAYNGSDLSYKVNKLQRNTEYKFRLAASNEEGMSKWSETICFRTLPDRPGPPNKPQTKGKILSTSFRLVWEPLKDTGGADITKYMVELDDGRGYELVYDGMERESICKHLSPGHQYRVRVCGCSPGGQGEWSDALSVTTLAVAPGQCQSPKLQGKPKATSLHLRWTYPDYDGGAQVTEFEVLMTLPDNSCREVYRGRELDFVVTGLAPGRPYLFQVRAYNKAGPGPWSDMLDIVSGAGVPDPPKSPLCHCKSPHSAIVSWEEPVNNGATITEYRLEWQQKLETDFSQLYFGPALSFEVRGLTPASSYSFRVQALNSAGAGPISGASMCLTPASSPGAVSPVRGSSSAETIALSWQEPCSNGSDIISYNIDIGDKTMITIPGSVTEYVVKELVPETTYKIRVQAVNSIGVGAFSSQLKITTRALPPNPPRLECLNCTPNSIKLKWGEGKNPDLVHYILEMLKDNGMFYPIYNGPNQSHKVNKLSELMAYDFRICARNEAGDGPYSDVFTFSTPKAPPAPVKALRCSEITLDSCLVEWQPSKAMNKDPIIYSLHLHHLHSKDQEYKQVYRGPESSYSLHSLSPKSEYQVRVHAIRQCQGESEGSEVSVVSELAGAFCPPVVFSTLSPEPLRTVNTRVMEAKFSEPKPLTDQQWAVIILLGFTIFAVILAFLTQQIISHTGSSNSTHHAAP